MSFTAFEAASRLARRHSGKGVADCSAGELLALADAINGAMIELYRVLPIGYRERDLVFSGEPRALASVDTVAGSAALGSAVFTAGEVGRTVLFSSGGDAAWHRVAGVDQLVLPWMGETGTQSATVYPDSLTSGDGQVERIVGDPMLVELGGTRRKLRLRSEGIKADTEEESPQLGTPEYYWLEPAGMLSGSTAVFYLRVWPIPVVAVRVIAKAQFWPTRLRAGDLGGGAVLLPVPVGAIDDLLSIAGARIGFMPGWTGIDYRAVKAAEVEALARLRSWATATYAPANRVGTPLGW